MRFRATLVFAACVLMPVPEASAGARAQDQAGDGPLRWLAKAGKAGKAAKVGGAAKGGAGAAMGAKAVVAGGVAYAAARGVKVFGGLPADMADGALLLTRNADGGFLGMTRGAREARAVDDLRFVADGPPERVLMDPGVALDRASLDELADVELHVVDASGKAHPVRRADDGEHWLVEVKDAAGDVQDLVEFAADAVAEGYDDEGAKAPWVLPLVPCREAVDGELDWRVPAGVSNSIESARTWLEATDPQRVLVIGEADAELDGLLETAAGRGHRMVLAQLDEPCAVGVGTIYARVEDSMSAAMPLRGASELDEFEVLRSTPLATVANVSARPELDGLRRVGWTFPEVTEGLDAGRPIHVQWWAGIVGFLVMLAMVWYVPPMRWIARPLARFIGRTVREARDPDPQPA